MNRSTDIVVIGGGVIGLSCAWRLAQRGCRVIVLEQSGHIPGASRFSLGVLAPSTPLGDSSFRSLHRKSLSLFDQFAQELEELTNLSIHFHHCGGLEIIPDQHQYIQALKEVEESNARNCRIDGQAAIELLSPRDSKKLEPLTRTSEFGALYNRSIAQVSVEHLLLALQTACKKSGVELEENCKATGLVLDSDSPTVRCGAQSISCDKILVTAGAWTSALHPLLKTYAHMEPVRGQALLVQSDRTLIQRIIKWNNHYLIPGEENTLILGSTTEKDCGFSLENTVEGINTILTHTQEAVPALADCTIIKMWAGLRPIAPDSKPHIGAVPEVDTLFVATGHYKIGFGFAPLTSSVIADLICKGSSEERIEALAPRKAQGLN